MQNFTNKPLQDLEKMSDEELLKIYKTAETGDPQGMEARRILDQRRDAKPLEEMSDRELSEICAFNLFQNHSYEEEQRRKKASNILASRKAKRKAERDEIRKQKKKALDDGSIKGLILSGNYSKVNHGVIIQNISDENAVTWTVYGNISPSQARTKSELMREKQEGKPEKAEKCALKVITICRRRLKKEDIILCGVDSIGNDVKNGIVFTEKRIYTFYKEKPEFIIEYSEIDDVDYTDDSVIIKTVTGETAKLYLGDKGNPQEYAENMFNLIMDIKDRLEES